MQIQALSLSGRGYNGPPDISCSHILPNSTSWWTTIRLQVSYVALKAPKSNTIFSLWLRQSKCDIVQMTLGQDFSPIFILWDFKVIHANALCPVLMKKLT